MTFLKNAFCSTAMRQAVDIPLTLAKILNNTVKISWIYVSAAKQDNCIVN